MELEVVAGEEGEPSDLEVVAEVVLGIDVAADAELFPSTRESVRESVR